MMSNVLQRSLLYACRWPPPAAAENSPRANAPYPDDDDLDGELGALGDGRERPRWLRGRLKLRPVVSASAAAACRSSSACRSLELKRRRMKLTPDEKFSRQPDSAISRPSQRLLLAARPHTVNVMKYNVSQKTSPTFLAVTLESIVGFS